MKKLLGFLFLLAAFALSACDVGIDPIEVAVCMDGPEMADMREYCFGPRPADPLNPEPGDFNQELCDQVRFDFQCDSPQPQALIIMSLDEQLI